MLQKPFFCFIILCLPALYADVQYEYRFGTPDIVNNEVRLKGCRTTRKGFAPMVAVKSVQLMLPLGHEAESFEVTFNEPVLLDGEYYLRPYIPNARYNKEINADLHAIKSPIYERNEFYPKSVRENWFSTQYKNGVPIFITSLNPVQYNPVTGKIKYFKSISLKVHTGPASRSVPYVCTPATKSIIQMIVDNKNAVADLALSPKYGNEYEYLIISPDHLKDCWDDFVAFNKRRCMRTRIETISNILANNDGRDDAEKVRNFIIKEYTENNVVFVLLGGDVTNNSNSIPYREFRAQMYDCKIAPEKYHDDKDIKADMYFSCLDGDWITDDNGTVHDYFGEPGTIDMFWEVYTARFPVDNETDLQNIINKTIKYSEDPVADQVTNNFLAGNFMWDDFGVDVWGGDYVEQFMDVCTENGYTTYGFPSDKWNTERLYDKTNEWSVTQFRSKVNSHKPTWIDHMGHGNQTYSFKETNSGVTNTNYQNDGTNANFFIIITSACYPGDFVYNDCLLEQFIKLRNGAVGCIGCSKSSWGSDYGTDGSTHRPFRYTHDAIFNPAKRVPFLEPIHAIGKEANAEIVLNTTINDPPYYGSITYCVYETNLLGDPALSIWTEKPKKWSKLPDYTATATEFTMTTPPYTWVALVDESDNIITAMLTGFVAEEDDSFILKDSICKINDEAYKNYVLNNPGKKLKVRIKAPNYLWYESEIDINTNVNAKESGAHPISYTIKSFGDNLLIQYTLSADALTTVELYNAKGVLLKTLLHRGMRSGSHVLTYNYSALSSGVYYCKLATPQGQRLQKFHLTK